MADEDGAGEGEGVMPVPITEEECRATTLQACRRVLKLGRTITLGRLRSFGAKGGDVRIMNQAQDLAEKGIISWHAYNEGRNRKRRVEGAAMTFTDRMVEDYERAWRRIYRRRRRQQSALAP